MAENKVVFLIVSNIRSGSTWLATGLDRLPDVRVDFELVWRPRFRTFTAAHRVVSTWRTSVKSIIENCLDDDAHQVIGSKLILEPVVYGPVELRDLILAIEQDIRVIHLTRDISEVCHSALHSQGHTLTQSADAYGSHAVSTLIKQSNARVRNQAKTKRNIFEIIGMTLLFRRNNAVMKLNEKAHTHYLTVDYSEIEERWDEICDFVGSTAPDDQRRRALETAPTSKNKHVPLEDRLINADDARAMIEIFSRGGVGRWLARCVKHFGFRFPLFLMGGCLHLLLRLKESVNFRMRLRLFLK